MISPLRDGHGAHVAAWEARVGRGLAPEQLFLAFEEAFRALWERAHQTLGDVTLIAIVDRVLYTAAEQHPVLSPLSVDGSGLLAEELRARAGSLPPEALALAVRFVLTELLRVLGNLTADILTPALHEALASAGHGQNPEKTP
jgi:hypothetical protein